MHFDEEILNYLKGSAFSSGLVVKIARKDDIFTDRTSLIENLCRDKDIIHLGCVDHLPLIREKLKQGLWLHERLCTASHRCLGIDINAGGIEFLEHELGYEDVICADIVRDEIGEVGAHHWDYLVLGEILEHTDNPCSFLAAIRKKYSGTIDRLIITVPNALSWQNITRTFIPRGVY
jgi:hypothetical protein